MLMNMARVQDDTPVSPNERHISVVPPVHHILELKRYYIGKYCAIVRQSYSQRFISRPHLADTNSVESSPLGL